MSTALFVIVCAVLSYFVAVAGSFIINYIWGSPASLHKEQQAIIKAQSEAIKELEKKPDASPQEATIRRKVMEAIAGASEAELSILRVILEHEEIEAPALYQSLAYIPSGRGSIETSLQKWRGVLIKIREVSGTHETFYSIIPAFKDALNHILYGS